MAELEETKYEVGTRCVCEGYCATIRYVGEVPPTKGKSYTIIYETINVFSGAAALVLSQQSWKFSTTGL